MVPPPPASKPRSVTSPNPEETPARSLGLAPKPKPDEPPVVYTATRQRFGRKRVLIGLLILLAILLIGGGIAAYYFLVVQPNAATTGSTTPSIELVATAPTQLVQQTSAAALKSGGVTNAAPTFTATLPTAATTGTAAVEVEVQPLTSRFIGTPTASGQAVSATGHDLALPVSLTTTLPDGSYHWQARTKVGTVTSAWVPYAAATSGTPTADFIVTTVAPAAPTLGQIGSNKVNGLTATTTLNQPPLSGTTAPGSTLTITVTPDNITLPPTVAAAGTWTATPTQQLANGTHTITLVATDGVGNHSQSVYTLTINPPVAAAAASTGTTATPAVTPKLAPTGDTTSLLTLLALLAGATSILALAYLRRYDRS